MGCGCNKRKGGAVLPTPAGAQPAAAMARAAGQQQLMYDAYTSEGVLVASFTNPVTARAEARRSGGFTKARYSNQTPDPAPLAATAITDPATSLNQEG